MENFQSCLCTIEVFNSLLNTKFLLWFCWYFWFIIISFQNYLQWYLKHFECLRWSDSSWNVFISQKHFVITKHPGRLLVVDCILNLPELKIGFSDLHDVKEVTNERKRKFFSSFILHRDVYSKSYVNWWAPGNDFGSEMPMILWLGKFTSQADAWCRWSSWSLGRCIFGPSWWKGTNISGRAGMISCTETSWRHSRWQGPEPQLWQCSCPTCTPFPL